MRRAAALILFAVMLFVCGITAYAAVTEYKLTPDNYKEWRTLRHINNERGNYYQADISASPAYRDFDVSSANSVHIVFEAGAYNEYGGAAAGEVEAAFLSGEDTLFTARCSIPSDGNFSRYELGTSELYAGLPDGTDTVRITIHSGGAYYRNFSVALSDTAARDMSVSETIDMTSGSITPVDVRVTRADYLIMVGFVCAVALIMMITVKIRDRYRKK